MTCGKPKRKAKTSHQSGGRRPPPPDPPAAYHTPQTHQPPQQPPAPTQKYTRRIYGFIELYQLSWSPRNQQAVPAAPVALTSLVASPTRSF